MWLVTIFGASILIKKEFTFSTIEEANDFLKRENFVFDEYEEEEHVYYWSVNESTFALIEKK